MEKMKQTGIVRKIDELGRWVIPMEVRRNLGIKSLDKLELFIGPENEIILKRFEPTISDFRRLEDLIEIFEEKNEEGKLNEVIEYLKKAEKLINENEMN